MADISQQLTEIGRAVEVVRISLKTTENGQRNNSFFFRERTSFRSREKEKH